ncbi:hypothetical protein [Streptomyces sp. NPDC101150]|uniref:hypothetical protein n=1 Tax=Streptomyces sp. NPDC101150 TaxID=3366114 RepID=UPI0038041498
MKLSVLLHHRDFLRGAGFDQGGFPRYFGLAERHFTFLPHPRHFDPIFQPVTEAVSERARLNVFTFLVICAFLIGFRCRNSFRAE